MKILTKFEITKHIMNAITTEGWREFGMPLNPDTKTPLSALKIEQASATKIICTIAETGQVFEVKISIPREEKTPETSPKDNE